MLYSQFKRNTMMAQAYPIPGNTHNEPMYRLLILQFNNEWIDGCFMSLSMHCYDISWQQRPKG